MLEPKLYLHSKVVNSLLQYKLYKKGLTESLLGPVVGYSNNLQNLLVSSCITISHLNGKYKAKRAEYWQRHVRLADIKYQILPDPLHSDFIYVNGTNYHTIEWLKEHETEWLPEWLQWSQVVATTTRKLSIPTDVICYCQVHSSNIYYLSLVEWKRWYLVLAQELITNNPAYQELQRLYQTQSLVLTNTTNHEDLPITKDYIIKLYDSNTIPTVAQIVASLLVR